MKYTYKISDANSEIFSGLKDDIGYLYPEFVFEKEITNADGSLTDFFRCERTGERIAAELRYGENSIVLSSDMAMPKLAKKRGLYIVGDRKFKKRWFILLLIFNIAAVCVMTVAAYRYKFGTMAAAFLIQFVIFMISVFYVKKYEKDIAGGENYAKTKIYALVFIVVKIAALIFIEDFLDEAAFFIEYHKLDIFMFMLIKAAPDIVGYIAMAVALGFIMIKLKKKGAVYNKYRLIVYAFNIASVPYIALEMLGMVIVLGIPQIFS